MWCSYLRGEGVKSVVSKVSQRGQAFSVRGFPCLGFVRRVGGVLDAAAYAASNAGGGSFAGALSALACGSRAMTRRLCARTAQSTAAARRP